MRRRPQDPSVPINQPGCRGSSLPCTATADALSSLTLQTMQSWSSVPEGPRCWIKIKPLSSFFLRRGHWEGKDIISPAINLTPEASLFGFHSHNTCLPCETMLGWGWHPVYGLIPRWRHCGLEVSRGEHLRAVPHRSSAACCCQVWSFGHHHRAKWRQWHSDTDLEQCQDLDALDRRGLLSLVWTRRVPVPFAGLLVTPGLHQQPLSVWTPKPMFQCVRILEGNVTFSLWRIPIFFVSHPRFPPQEGDEAVTIPLVFSVKALAEDEEEQLSRLGTCFGTLLSHGQRMAGHCQALNVWWELGALLWHCLSAVLPHVVRFIGRIYSRILTELDINVRFTSLGCG